MDVEAKTSGTQTSWPLTEAQEGLWYAQALAQGSDGAAFNTALLVDLRGPLDIERLRRAADAAATEAEALSLRVWRDADGALRQAPDPARRPLLRVLDVPDEAAARAAIAADMARPLDPATDAPAAQRLFRLTPSHHVLYQRAHHLVLDGFGADLLLRRVATLYAAGDAAPNEPPLPPFARVAETDAAYRDGPKRAADAAYWRELMRDAPAVPGGPAAAPAALRARATLPPGTGALLRRAAEAEGLAWPDLLTVLLAAYCRRMTGEAEAVVGVTFMNRFGSAAARVPSTLMNVLPLRLRGGEEGPPGATFAATFADTLADVLGQLARLRRHGRYRGEQLRRDLRRAGRDRPLFGPVVNVQPFHAVPAFPGLHAALEILGTGPVEDLTFDVRTDSAAETIHLDVEGNPHRHAAAAVAATAARAAHFVAAVLEAGTLHAVPTATPAEAARALRDAQGENRDLPDTTLPALIAATVRARPTAPALRFGSALLDYAALDRRAAALAAALIARGAGPGRIVAVALERSVPLVVGLFGVLRSGAAYLPLDPSHPAERLGRIAASARPVVLLAEAPLAGLAPFPPADWPTNAPAAPPPGPAPTDAAYVLYTSGSTGEPKGVVVEHRAIVNRLLWMAERYGFGPDDRVLQKTPTTFDVSVWELFLSFVTGGTLVLAPPGAHRDPEAVAALVREEGITVLHFVPSMLGAFLAHPAAAGLAPRLVFCSGEELTPALRDRFHAAVRAELHNLYGPTEAAVDVSAWDASATDRSAPVPIGFPVWNTALHVLDARLGPLPPGVPGDLFIAGRQLAREYLGRPDLTARAFVPDPFRPGERMYRTGDLALRRPDGALLFLGRKDGQVKLRGQRLELSEVEAALLRVPGIRDARVVAREDRPGDQRLVAYLVPGPEYDRNAVRVHVAVLLPDYMVPSAFVALDRLPVNASGKLDRAALPAPEASAGGGRAPETPTERRLAVLFADCLGVSAVGAEDDFFAAGGHSLLAVDLVLAIEREWNRDPGLGAVFEHPTVARLAAVLDAAAPAGGAPPPEADDGLRPLLRLGPPEAPRVLFAVHPAGGLGWCYGALARALAPHASLVAVQAPTLRADASPPASLHALAADYADRIAAAAPPGPVHLLGWSVGGIIAQEVAATLAERGRPVGLLALLDSYPADAWRNRAEPGEGAMLRALLLIAGHDPATLEGLPLERNAVLGFLRRGGTALGQLPDAALDGVLRVVADNNRLVRGHAHRRFPGPALHLRAARDHAGTSLVPALWSPYLAATTVLDVDATHGGMIAPAAVAAFAPVLLAGITGRDASG